MRYLLLATLLFLAPTSASAHPDHSAVAPVGLLHYLSDPFHLSVAVVGILVLVSVASWLRRLRVASSC